MNKWTLILPHSYHLTCLKLLRPLRRAGLDLLVVGTNCGQWRPFWGKGTDRWTNLTLLRKKPQGYSVPMCASMHTSSPACTRVIHTHIPSSVPVCADQPACICISSLISRELRGPVPPSAAAGESLQPQYSTRVGQTVLLPMQVFFFKHSITIYKVCSPVFV